MTRADRWKQRSPVVRYWKYKDELKKLGIVDLPFGYWIRFYLPMPKSWSKKKREAMAGTYHKQKPDKDNLEKAILDCVMVEDCAVCDGRVSKFWSHNDRGYIEILAPEFTL